MKFCRFCGAKLLRPNAHFCPKCGKKLIIDEPATAVNVPRIDTPVVNAPSNALKPLTQQEVNIEEYPSIDMSPGLFARRYKLIKRIGNGNMSEVYQAEDIRRPNKIVAVKLLNTSHKDVIKQEVYRRETRALEQLEHPNIVKHLDYGWSDERRCHYIVLEYLPRTLVDEIAIHRESSDQDWCWPLMRDITDALVHAHSKGIIHRDLKTTNILISESNVPKLTDFGISLLRFEIRTGVTLSGYWSEGFAAPEQRSTQKTTEQSDIYSLGCVFYHMLSREEPPAGGVKPQDIQSLNLRPLMKQMFERMLDPEAGNRFESAEQLARFLEHTWKLQTYPDVYFVVTTAVARKLFDASLTNKPSQEYACRYLNEHFMQDKQDNFPKGVQIKLEKDGRYHIFTDTMKFICVKEEKSPILVIVDIQIYIYPPTFEDQRNRVAFYRRRWHFIRHSSAFPSEKRDQLQQTLEELSHELTVHKQEDQARRKQKRERKDFTSIWNKVLELQQQMLDNAKTLEYDSWHREGNTITFQLKRTVPDDLGWPDSAPIAFQSEGKRTEPIGFFMGGSGTTVEVSTTQGGTLEQTSSRGGLPLHGRIGLFQIQTIASLEKQRRALEMLISGGTVNPRLPDVLQDLSTAEFAPLDEDIVFSQPLGEDQKSAVRQALATQDVFLLQGPPGTGKTTTLSEIIVQILKEKPDARILVSSQSNVAVNHVLSKVAKGAGGVGMLRIGRPERIGPGAEEWTLEKQLSTWRNDVISRTSAVIQELETQVQSQHHGFIRGKLPPEQLQDLQIYRVWLEELTSDIDDLADYEQRIKRLSERLQQAAMSSNQKAQEVRIELEDYRRKRNKKKEYIEEILEQVRLALPEDAWQDFVPTDFVTERERLYKIITELLSPDSSASTEEKLLALVQNWQNVFGKLDDFAEPLFERANILAATCLITGARQLRDIEFDWAIIDEGGRATATELLVPLVRSRRSIIVGDERQLPPMLDTDLRSEALQRLQLRRDELEKSLFETLVAQGRDEELPAVQMLKGQYRMHPAIGEMISQVFYDGKLKHETDHESRDHKLPWLDTAIVWYSTTRLPNHAESPRGSSFSNATEASVIVWILQRLEKSYREIDEKRDVAVITPYNEQILLLRERIRPSNRTRWMQLSIEIATVDAFQGRDSNIVLYSTVRSNKRRELGFLKDRRRLNVALSRAQQLLIMVGDIGMLGDARGDKDGNPYQYLIRYMRNNPDDCLIEDVEPEDLHE